MSAGVVPSLQSERVVPSRYEGAARNAGVPSRAFALGVTSARTRAAVTSMPVHARRIPGRARSGHTLPAPGSIVRSASVRSLSAGMRSPAMISPSICS